MELEPVNSFHIMFLEHILLLDAFKLYAQVPNVIKYEIGTPEPELSPIFGEYEKRLEHEPLIHTCICSSLF